LGNDGKIKIGIIGVGGMGRSDANDVHTLQSTELTAVCDVDASRADDVAGQYGATAYYDAKEMFDNPGLDGVIIATPHYAHTPLCIDAFRRGIHVLVEKPIAVHARDARKMILAYDEARAEHSNLMFVDRFMQRTYGYWKKNQGHDRWRRTRKIGPGYLGRHQLVPSASVL
jgi:predicted dehydrogenase